VDRGRGADTSPSLRCKHAALHCWTACLHTPTLTTPLPASSTAAPLPRAPMLFEVPVTCNTGRMVQPRGARLRGGMGRPAGPEVHRASMCRNTTPAAFPAPSRNHFCCQNITADSFWHQSPRGGRGMGCLQGRDVCPSAAFTKPRPPPGCAKSALFSQCCVMLQKHALK